jgi:hypothetical protein
LKTKLLNLNSIAKKQVQKNVKVIIIDTIGEAHVTASLIISLFL